MGLTSSFSRAFSSFNWFSSASSSTVYACMFFSVGPVSERIKLSKNYIKE